MAKITLPTISGGYASVTQIEQGFNQIESEFQNKVLYRNNPSGEANQMENNIDMNSNSILNVSGLGVQSLTIGGTPVIPSGVVAGEVPIQTGHANKFLQTDGTTASWEVPDASEITYTATGTGAVARTAQDKLRESVSVKDFGAVGDGVTDDTAAIQAALNYWVAQPVGLLEFPAGQYLVSAPLSATFSSSDYKGKTITGYGAVLVSGLSTGYMLTITSAATFRYLKINGLGFNGGAAESGCLKLDGGAATASAYLYGASLSDVKFDNFNGNGLECVNNVFESSLVNVQARAIGTNTTGYCLFFQNGALGSVLSSIDLYGCITSGGLKGVYVKSPTADIRIHGGTYILAQEEGIRLENDAGSSIINPHVENNYQGAVDLASGGAGIYCTNRSTIMGAYGTTNSKQKYVVRLYVGAGQVSQIIGGNAGGSTVSYAYLDGGAGSNVWLFGSQTYEVNGTNVLVNKVGSSIEVGRGNNKGFIKLENNSSNFDMTFYRWSGSGTSYAANRIKTSGNQLQMLSATAVANVGDETYGSPVFSIDLNNKLSFYNSTPISKQAVSGSRGGNAALADLLTKLAAYGIITDSTSA